MLLCSPTYYSLNVLGAVHYDNWMSIAGYGPTLTTLLRQLESQYLPHGPTIRRQIKCGNVPTGSFGGVQMRGAGLLGWTGSGK